MFTFFATIFIVYILWLVVMPVVKRYARRKFEEKVGDMFRRAYGFPRDDARGRSDDGAARHGSPASAPRRKVFSREDGEYVEFEDIRLTVDETSATSATGTASARGANGHNPVEPQVSDAEWEEIG